MKLATVNPQLDFNSLPNLLLPKDVRGTRTHNMIARFALLRLVPSSHESYSIPVCLSVIRYTSPVGRRISRWRPQALRCRT
jgi:hypothetical protein